VPVDIKSNVKVHAALPGSRTMAVNVQVTVTYKTEAAAFDVKTTASTTFSREWTA
jgi:hypothetical protein